MCRKKATFRGSDSNAKERFIYHTAGLDGSGSASYIDEAVLIDADVNSGWTSAADSTKEVRRYYLYNWRHDAVMLLTDGGKLIQNMAYLAYGKAYGIPAGDRDGSGKWDTYDDGAISAAVGGPYRLTYDADFNGVIEAADVTHANSITGGYYDLGLDRLSTKEVFNRRGYAGYEHAWELDGTKYHVRYRVLDSELGRWNRRDPLQDWDENTYALCGGAPLIRIDADGRAWLLLIELGAGAVIGATVWAISQSRDCSPVGSVSWFEICQRCEKSWSCPCSPGTFPPGHCMTGCETRTTAGEECIQKQFKCVRYGLGSTEWRPTGAAQPGSQTCNAPDACPGERCRPMVPGSAARVTVCEIERKRLISNLRDCQEYCTNKNYFPNGITPASSEYCKCLSQPDPPPCPGVEYMDPK